MFTFKLDYNKPLYEQIKFLKKNWKELTKFINKADEDCPYYLMTVEVNLACFFYENLEQIKSNQLSCYKELEQNILNHLKNLDNSIITKEDKEFAAFFKSLSDLDIEKNFEFKNRENISLLSSKDSGIFSDDLLEEFEKNETEISFNDNKTDVYEFKDTVFIMND